MSEEMIIRHLKDRELTLLNELRKVQVALHAFIDNNIKFNSNQFADNNILNNIVIDNKSLNDAKRNFKGSDFADKNSLNIPLEYNSSLTYSNKVLYILANQKRPMLVEEITSEIHHLEPDVDVNKLHKNISYNLSMLAKYAKVKKHAFNRKIKYSV